MQMLIGEGYLIGSIDNETIAISQNKLSGNTPKSQVDFIKFDTEAIKQFTQGREVRVLIEIKE